jgi:prepilin-type N-terminal cleavage/methylation domain-containing protein
MRALRGEKKKTSGVTLIELLAVILIAGLLAAVGVPAFNAILKGTALRNAATGLTDTLAMARQLAIANRYLYRVEFITMQTVLTAGQHRAGVKENSYRIYFVDRKAKDQSNPRESEKVTIGKWKLLPRFVFFDSKDPPDEEIVFTSTGQAYGSDGGWPDYFKIVHTESGTKGSEKAMQIKVVGITGTARAKPAAASP